MSEAGIGSRKLKATPEEAWNFLHRYGVRLAGALASHQRMAERRLAEFAVEGPDRYGPDDLDGMIKAFRSAYTESGEALAELDRLAPLAASDDQIEDFLSTFDRLFPESDQDR